MPPAPPLQSRTGYLYAIGAYGLWGILPLYFLLLVPAGAFEVVAFRILMSLLFCALLLTIIRAWGRVGALLRDRRTMLLMALAAGAIYINWQVYVFAALGGHVIEASLGYFINPIVTVLLGVLVLREKVRPAQWAALSIAFVAILVIVVGYGAFPWIALALAFSFGAYGLIKRVVGPTVDAVGGLTLETAWLAPLALGQLVLVSTIGGGLDFGQNGLAHSALMVGAGVVTTVPLLLFAAGARRIPLVALGMTQFLAPLAQLLIGWLVLHEAMPLERWIGFALVWVALIVLMADMVAASRSSRRVADESI
ncbi:EamA family transporter RarD [Pseudolysinimonas yzui]|uniref:Protein RarD n=1 Tax=Pseudolysinimonas yzui TaxID=2708254 RepID=A0A8J3M2Y5_9MICO|nr:EamA family transporter RarD [Pseudolysinimonas yzui]GHF20446.1 protein RarD [Pseudolysinimonas yzui]